MLGFYSLDYFFTTRRVLSIHSRRDSVLSLKLFIHIFTRTSRFAYFILCNTVSLSTGCPILTCKLLSESVRRLKNVSSACLRNFLLHHLPAIYLL